MNKTITMIFFYLQTIDSESSINNIAFSSEYVFLSESGGKYAQIKHRLEVKTVLNSSKQICLWMLMCEDNRGYTFSLEEALL